MATDTPEAKATDTPITGTPDLLDHTGDTQDSGRPLFQTPWLGARLFRQATPAPEPQHGADRRDTAALDDLYAVAQDLQNAQAAQAYEMGRICTAIYQALDLLKQATRNPINVSVSLKASQGVVIDTQGFKHCFLLLTAAQTGMVFDIPGVGKVTRNLNADWNRLDYPDKTMIYLASDPAAGTQVNGIIRLTDDIINV